MIKVVSLDLDGVLFEKVHSNLLKNLSGALNVPEETLKEVLFVKAAKEGGYDDLKCGKKDPDEYWKWLFKELGVAETFNRYDYLNVLISGYSINEKGIKLINNLHQLGIKTAVCSNNYRDNIENLERNFHISSYFDYMLFSYEVGVLKPDIKIYRELVTKTNVKPSEIFYTDDKEGNLSTARELGMNTFLYTNMEGLVAELQGLGLEISLV